ncbi:hypothetical protein OQI87_01130 [Lactobacillus kefiranofaciens]|uniref:hypothetical protein n=1 Tax=Lactobacillus kefiranofaciens TaxID=267818 RepID=UPI002468AE46|nr:hypothetical protein [Lactobacillus kefiranofaciens]MDH5099778.1 hypothetical protein [Lactobacillus kefiranofaciens]
MNKEWLEESINGEAQINFESKFEDISFDNEQTRQAYQALQRTDEWEDFKKLMIEDYAKNITQNVLHKIEGLKDIVREAGEE